MGKSWISITAQLEQLVMAIKSYPKCWCSSTHPSTSNSLMYPLYFFWRNICQTKPCGRKRPWHPKKNLCTLYLVTPPEAMKFQLHRPLSPSGWVHACEFFFVARIKRKNDLCEDPVVYKHSCFWNIPTWTHRKYRSTHSFCGPIFQPVRFGVSYPECIAGWKENHEKHQSFEETVLLSTKVRQ